MGALVEHVLDAQRLVIAQVSQGCVVEDCGEVLEAAPGGHVVLVDSLDPDARGSPRVEVFPPGLFALTRRVV